MRHQQLLRPLLRALPAQAQRAARPATAALPRAAPFQLQAARHHGDHMDSPGLFAEREPAWGGDYRDWQQRPFTVGIGGPVGSGKTALVLKLCRYLRDKISLGVVTNDIFTREDCDFLIRNEALPAERVRAVETGGCPHAAIREDISGNIAALEAMAAEVSPKPELLLCESGGDNLAANFSRELSDYTIYVIDVAGGDKVPRKGGPGVTQSDLLIVNKTDLAEAVGSDLDVMAKDAKRMRGDGPTIFAAVRHGKGVEEIANLILEAQKEAVSGEGAHEHGHGGHGHSHSHSHGHSHSH
eukprot:TRINITY_DN3498_c0_g1_i12.p1 TRINITY_DN3498_c0_g1~~TRINITY_DN3498_c0_g1_i12.p1  ORF type:complete len:298 (-),score=71.49 TRINITY_DN3498_c0_g1_i12:223-1116(-)